MYTGHNYSPVGLDDRKQHTREVVQHSPFGRLRLG
jgi:hypothetical protein